LNNSLISFIIRLFKPNNLDEETLLCLSLSQYLASKEVMLLRQPQYKQTRDKTFNNAISSLDLLIIYLTYRKSFSLLTEVNVLISSFLIKILIFFKRRNLNQQPNIHLNNFMFGIKMD
jgi:hypothetical protein